MAEGAAWRMVYAHDRAGVPTGDFTEDDRRVLAAAVEGGLPVRVRYSGPDDVAPTHPVYSHTAQWVDGGHVWAQTVATIGLLRDGSFDEAPEEAWAVHSTTGVRHTKAFHRDTHVWRESDEGEDVELEWFIPTPSSASPNSSGGVAFVRPLGDSITAGYGFGLGKPRPPEWVVAPPLFNRNLPPIPPSYWPPNPVGGGYRAFLAGEPGIRLVGNLNDNSAQFMWQLGQQYHDGYSGYTTRQLLDVVQSPDIYLGADIVLVHVGTNDIWRSATADSTLEGLSSLLEALLQKVPNATIFVAQIIPMLGDSEDRCNPIVDSYNARIPQLVGDLSCGWNRTIRSVDLNKGMEYPQDYFYYPPLPPWIDGVHPGYLGAQKMANRWKAAIATLQATEPAVMPEYEADVLLDTSHLILGQPSEEPAPPMWRKGPSPLGAAQNSGDPAEESTGHQGTGAAWTVQAIWP